MTNDELAEFLAAETKQYVEEAVQRATARMEASFAERVERAVEERISALPLPIPQPGLPGKDGKDADPDVIERMVREAVALIPTPEPGKPGKDGQDADPEMIRAEVAKAVAALPVPKNGDPGKDGKDVDLLVVKALVDGAVANAVAALPPPKDGKDGITIEQLENGIIKALAAALGELHLDRRELKIGDRLIATIPFPLYEKVYQPDVKYEKGDMVTFGGDGWHCNEPTMDKPGTSGAWTLAIKKGRDFRPIDRERPFNGSTVRGPVKP